MDDCDDDKPRRRRSKHRYVIYQPYQQQPTYPQQTFPQQPFNPFNQFNPFNPFNPQFPQQFPQQPFGQQPFFGQQPQLVPVQNPNNPNGPPLLVNPNTGAPQFRVTMPSSMQNNAASSPAIVPVKTPVDQAATYEAAINLLTALSKVSNRQNDDPKLLTTGPVTTVSAPMLDLVNPV